MVTNHMVQYRRSTCQSKGKACETVGLSRRHHYLQKMAIMGGDSYRQEGALDVSRQGVRV
jgi:hypothetical protein